MPKPQLRAVDNQRAHPKDIARQAVAKWRSDADKERWPIVNVVDTGAPLLQRDKVLDHAHHDARLGRK